MTTREELSAMSKGIRRVQQHHLVSEQIEYIKKNFIDKHSHTDDITEYVKSLKPQSLKDGVMVRLIFALQDGEIR